LWELNQTMNECKVTITWHPFCTSSVLANIFKKRSKNTVLEKENLCLNYLFALSFFPSDKGQSLTHEHSITYLLGPNYLFSQEFCELLAFCWTILGVCHSLVGWVLLFAALHLAPWELLSYTQCCRVHLVILMISWGCTALVHPYKIKCDCLFSSYVCDSQGFSAALLPFTHGFIPVR
jgi:hypothetical protein